MVVLLLVLLLLLLILWLILLLLLLLMLLLPLLMLLLLLLLLMLLMMLLLLLLLLLLQMFADVYCCLLHRWYIMISTIAAAATDVATIADTSTVTPATVTYMLTCFYVQSSLDTHVQSNPHLASHLSAPQFAGAAFFHLSFHRQLTITTPVQPW